MTRLQPITLLPFGLVAALVFWLALQAFGLSTWITILNGGLIGSLFALTITYSRVITSWFVGSRGTDGVTVFGLFFMMTWGIIGLFIFNSIYVRAADLPLTTLLTTAIGRYVLIFCAWGMIAALDWGEAWNYGRDRKQLYIGLAIGLVVGAVLVYVQEYRLLA